MLLPTQARYAPGEPVVLELTPAPNVRTLTVTRLGRTVATVDVPPDDGAVAVGPLAEGGYGVSLDNTADTAIEVLADPRTRMRYGFVANFGPGRDIEPVLRTFRRLHLTAAQFYDWAYRHADLVSAQPEWQDPLGQRVALATVQALTSGLSAIGTLPIGYAAVYGVGQHEWPAWQHLALLRADGTPHELGGFLSIVDPSDDHWLAHFRADLTRAARAGGFAGFHLDQYGFPRHAVRPDGRVVDLAVAFDTLIHAVREELPDACLIFNNVNDFPVWATTRSPQDVTYTEVWQPHDTLADLAAVATRSRALSPHRPVVLAAYQSCYATSSTEVADTTTRLTMATLFSHGATQLLAGEAGHVLIDPYYVRNHVAPESTMDMLTSWYDLLVAAGDILLDPAVVDITGSVTGPLNDEVDIVTDLPVNHHGEAGTIWRRVVDTPHGTVMHLINLTAQTETGWDTPKQPLNPVRGLRLRVRRTGSRPPGVHLADPDQGPHFRAIAVSDTAGEHVHFDLPPLFAWQIVLIRSADTAPSGTGPTGPEEDR
jgi:dextranase